MTGDGVIAAGEVHRFGEARVHISPPVNALRL
jgi:hypothetical protein